MLSIKPDFIRQDTILFFPSPLPSSFFSSYYYLDDVVRSWLVRAIQERVVQQVTAGGSVRHASFTYHADNEVSTTQIKTWLNTFISLARVVVCWKSICCLLLVVSGIIIRVKLSSYQIVILLLCFFCCEYYTFFAPFFFFFILLINKNKKRI